MSKHEQAPRLVNKNKPKAEGSFIMVNMELFQQINSKIDSRHGLARSLLFLLVGTADGFGLSQKFMTDNLRCTKQAYLDARKYLHDLGLITVDTPNKRITINYDAIMGITKITPESIIENTSKKESITEFTSKGSSQITSQGITEITPMGISQFTYNIEETEKKQYKETENVFSSDEEKTTAAPNKVGLAVPEVLSDEEKKTAKPWHTSNLRDYKEGVDYVRVSENYIKARSGQIFKLFS